MRPTALGLLLYALLLLLPGLGKMGAFDTTDARYLEIAREMHASGDWIMPRLAARPHLDKPPLTYWAAALGYRAFGVSPLSGRLLAELALAATAVLIAVAGRRLCGREGAVIAGGVVLSSALAYTSSRGLSTDLFQLLLFSGAMFAFLRGVEGEGRPAFVVLALFLLGLSMNVKGPIALFVAVLIWIPFLALTRGRTRLSGRALALGLVLFVIVGAPWYLALWANDPGVMRYFLETQLLGRVTGAAPGVHLHPPYYLFAVWPLGLLPWTPLIVLALLRLWPRAGWRRAEPIDLYLLLWSIVPVLFFSIPRSKLATYLLVGFPAAGLALGLAFERGWLEGRAGRRALAGCAGLGCGAGLVLALFVLAAPHIAHSGKLDAAVLAGRPLLGAALATSSALLAFVVQRLLRRRASIAHTLVAIALGTGLLFAIAFQAIGPALVSLREEGLLARSVPGSWLIQAGVDRVSALYYFGNLAQFRFTGIPSHPRRKPPNRYWEHELSGDEALAILRGEQPVFCLTKPKFASELGEASGAVVVLRRQETVLLANRAAQTALAANALAAARR